MMLEADYIVDLGPRAGRLGGNIVFAGTPKEMLKTDTLTARYLTGKKKSNLPPKENWKWKKDNIIRSYRK